MLREDNNTRLKCSLTHDRNSSTGTRVCLHKKLKNFLSTRRVPGFPRISRHVRHFLKCVPCVFADAQEYARSIEAIFGETSAMIAVNMSLVCLQMHRSMLNPLKPYLERPVPWLPLMWRKCSQRWVRNILKYSDFCALFNAYLYHCSTEHFSLPFGFCRIKTAPC